MHPSSLLLSGHQSYMLQRYLLFGLYRSFCWETDYCGCGLVGWLAPSPVGCQILPCAEAAIHWWSGPGHKVVGCGTP